MNSLTKRFSMATNIDCDPQSPWQRGSDENTNLLLRQYFPRQTDLAPHTQAQLNKVRQLNERPGKRWTSTRQQGDIATVLRRPVEPAADNWMASLRATGGSKPER